MTLLVGHRLERAKPASRVEILPHLPNRVQAKCCEIFNMEMVLTIIDYSAANDLMHRERTGSVE
jgi:hypothetical protein